MPTFAAIDIGSNSCRLAIASVQQHRLKMLYEEREVVRLGASVFETGMISPEAMDLTIKALKRFQKATQTHVVDRVRVVATSAMRDARNSEAFRAWVKSTTGWNVEVISGLEEGRLIHLGVVTHEPGAKGRCLMIDLGGGSCEVTLSEAGRIRSMVSMPLGAVRLQQEFMHTDPPGKEEIAGLRKYIGRELERGERRLGQPRVALVIATSGTASALAEASRSIAASAAKGKKRALTAAARAKADIVPTAHVRLVADQLMKMTNEQRANFPGIGPKRSEIIVGGAQVYAMLLERFALKGFRYSARSLRDGVLAQMLADVDTRASVHRTVENERREGVLQLCKRYGVDARKQEAERVQVSQLFDQLQRVHELPDDYKTWLEAAAMMQNVGKYMNHQGHHRHTQYIIANSDIFGFSPEQRAIVAAIARYQGKSRPDSMDRPMRAIPLDEHTHVARAVMLLRLVQALNQDQATAALRMTARVYPKRVILEIHGARGGAELEQWSLRKEADYFLEVFRRALFVEVA
ncbi:exopolyphosphatase / guanosine-5'-triphosphate,3'-diphosphate pyrophosphatase [Bryocella elongata]|uniref:Exopolyphosphatase / guanosine-5'-triphosphate,3'-diphosphate pyrophosphatase n=1 Tax=Bryocella elongata TaxID=863522 RepID=A0A1H6BZW9_9BACT|nr:Ppx/GppA phosphatase family protein [Bryocella elongata]SEG66037.1 exopolyphosphatase / guanosine-5'-triphosphate,3'-diphosphate pyrophosphatase [Bryocella elongata]